MAMATIGQKPVFLDDEATLAALESPQFLPRENVYLPANARSLVAAADPTARIISSRVQPEEFVFETSANSNAMVVIAQSYHHCWKATVDGKPAELLRANYAFQAVEVPAGHHEVRLVYRDKWFWSGIVISVSALLFCVIKLVR
jgi:hypothetical protein